MSKARPVVMITGCSAGGIGCSLVEHFHAQGCCVVATARRLDSMQCLKALPGVELVQLDVCNTDSIQAAVSEVMQKMGRIDILVNNAGVVTWGPAAEVPMSAVRQCFEANVFGLLDMCQAVIPVMAMQGSGKIINISSLVGFTPVPLRGIYSASKAAVIRLSDALRLECDPLGISVLVVTPGFIDSNARHTAKEAASDYSSGAVHLQQQTLWPGWMGVLDMVQRKLLKNVVPVDLFAAKLVAVCLRAKVPSYWIGPCAGIEWMVRYNPLPQPIKDWLLRHSLGMVQLEPAVKENLAQRRAAGAAAAAEAQPHKAGLHTLQATPRIEVKAP